MTSVNVNMCEHINTVIWEPHLAGARKCLGCGKVYNPNLKPNWQFEFSEDDPIIKLEKEIDYYKQRSENYKNDIHKNYRWRVEQQIKISKFENLLRSILNTLVFVSTYSTDENIILKTNEAMNEIKEIL